MPWDAAALVVRGPDGETVVAGGHSPDGRAESVVQRVWDADGALWFCADRTGVWSLYRWRPGSEVEALLDVGADIAGPQWRFGARRFAVLDDGRALLAFSRNGADRLAVREADGTVGELDLPYTAFRSVTAAGDSVVCVAGSPATEPVVFRVPADGGPAEILRPARDPGVDPAWFSRPEHVPFPTPERGTGIDEAHALVYPPTNPEAAAPEGTLPPLLVVVHGGADGRGDLRAGPRGPKFGPRAASASPT